MHLGMGLSSSACSFPIATSVSSSSSHDYFYQEYYWTTRPSLLASCSNHYHNLPAAPSSAPRTAGSLCGSFLGPSNKLPRAFRHRRRGGLAWYQTTWPAHDTWPPTSSSPTLFSRRRWRGPELWCLFVFPFCLGISWVVLCHVSSARPPAAPFWLSWGSLNTLSKSLYP